MVDVNFVGQLVEAMAEAVEKLETAMAENNLEYTNKLRVFITDLYNKTDEALLRIG